MTKTTTTERPMKLHHVSITPKTGGEPTVRLVRAKTINGAHQHVSGTAIVVRVATPEEAHELGRAGVEIETAGEQPAEPIAEGEKP